ncbi:uncharacterized protein LOC142340262 isoform X2 [Convolutriloba macropyga]
MSSDSMLSSSLSLLFVISCYYCCVSLITCEDAAGPAAPALIAPEPISLHGGHIPTQLLMKRGVAWDFTKKVPVGKRNLAWDFTRRSSDDTEGKRALAWDFTRRSGDEGKQSMPWDLDGKRNLAWDFTKRTPVALIPEDKRALAWDFTKKYDSDKRALAWDFTKKSVIPVEIASNSPPYDKRALAWDFTR